MTDCREVMFMSDAAGTVQCVDPRIGTVFTSYRRINSTHKNTLALLGEDYVLVADANKPLLTVWPLNSQEPVVGPKVVMAGKVTALSSSKDGVHTVLAIDAKIYVYLNSTGALLGVINKHYRGITKLLFLANSVHFVSCGENGSVLVWSLASALTGQKSVADELSGCEPVYTFSHHSLPVTDAYAGAGGIKSRLYTSSLDQTVKMYNLRDGSLLLSIAFETSITAIRPNCIETALFLGSINGQVLEYSLDPLPRTLDHQAQNNDMKKPLEGHKKAVNCLDASIDGQLLVSGSEDCTVIVWDIPSRQLLRIFNMKGVVCSLLVTLSVPNLFTDDFKPKLEFQNFQRVSSGSQDLHFNVMINENLHPIDYSLLEEKNSAAKSEISNCDDVNLLKQQLAQVVEKNKRLYEFAMEHVLKTAYDKSANKRKAAEIE